MAGSSDATTDVQISGRPEVFVDREADIRIDVPITRADDPWVHVFDAAADEASNWGWNIYARSESVDVTVHPSAVKGALDFVKKKIEEVNLLRKRLAEQADEFDAAVEQWWNSQGADE